MIRSAVRDDLRNIDYLGHLFNTEIQKNSPLNVLKRTRYVPPRSIRSSDYYRYISSDHGLFVAVEDGEIVGFVSGRVLNQTGKKVDRYGKVDDVYVVKKWRGQGIADDLVEVLLSWLKKQRCKHVVLFASPDSPIARYYKKLGFKTLYHYMAKRV